MAGPEDAHQKVFDSLRKLVGKEADFRHFDAYLQQTNENASPRGAAILMAANVEIGVKNALIRIMHRDRFDIMFRTGRPLDDFRNKIWAGYAFGLYGQSTFVTLEGIRKIRNAFAHAQIPISFDDVEVRAACATLELQPLRTPYTVGANEKDVSGLQGRDRFAEACQRVGHNLNVLNLGGQYGIEPRALGTMLPVEVTQVFGRQEPLP